MGQYSGQAYQKRPTVLPTETHKRNECRQKSCAGMAQIGGRARASVLHQVCAVSRHVREKERGKGSFVRAVSLGIKVICEVSLFLIPHCGTYTYTHGYTGVCLAFTNVHWPLVIQHCGIPFFDKRDTGTQVCVSLSQMYTSLSVGSIKS